MAYSTTHSSAEQKWTGDTLLLKAVAVKTAEAIKKGDIVLIKAADGLAYVAFATAASATGDMFAGIAYEDKTSAADTDTVRVIVAGEVELTFASAAQANVGDTVWHDNGTNGGIRTVAASAGTHACPVGVVTELSGTNLVRVKLKAFDTAAA